MLPTRCVATIAVALLILFSVIPSWPQGQVSGPPRLPFTDNGACPFEGCQYGSWTAITSVVAQKETNVKSPAAFKIKAGEKIEALGGKVITRQFGIVKILKPVVFDDVDTSKVPYSVDKFEVPAGAVLYVLHYEGEGSMLYWYNGATHSRDLTEGLHLEDEVPYEIVSEPKYEWWVHVMNHTGATGWIMNPEHFRGMDLFGD